MNLSTKGLKDCLECASIYKGTSAKKKTDFIEMIVYGYMSETLNKKDLKDKNKRRKQILNKNTITINSLPGHGNMGLKKKEIKSQIKEKTFIKVC